MITRPVSHATTRTLAAYLEGELDAHETRAIEAHLQASEDVRRQLDELREIRDALARPAPEVADMDLTGCVMSRVEALPPAKPGVAPGRMTLYAVFSRASTYWCANEIEVRATPPDRCVVRGLCSAAQRPFFCARHRREPSTRCFDGAPALRR